MSVVIGTGAPRRDDTNENVARCSRLGANIDETIYARMSRFRCVTASSLLDAMDISCTPKHEFSGNHLAMAAKRRTLAIRTDQNRLNWQL